MLSKEQLAKFDKEGFLVLENFFNSEQCLKMYQEAGKVIEQIIDNEDLEQISTFPFVSKGDTPSKGNFDYFEQSASDIKLFLNKKEFTAESHHDTQAKARVIRKRANRLGHALHALNPVFREITFSPEVKEVVKSLNFRKPIVCQSMYLMMQSPEGPSSTGHQASTYVIVEPSKLVGFWVAVTDCTVENGCLEVIPGSHKKGGLKNKFIRNPNKKEWEEGKRFVYTEGKAEYPQEGYVPIPLKAGAVLLMDGFLVHRATNCTASEPRNVFAFHVYDSDKAEFSKENWMAFNPKTFLPFEEHEK